MYSGIHLLRDHFNHKMQHQAFCVRARVRQRGKRARLLDQIMIRVARVIDTVNKNIDFSHRLPAVDLDQILTTAVEDMERRTPTKTPSFVLPPHSCIKHHKRSVNHALRNQELKNQGHTT